MPVGGGSTRSSGCESLLIQSDDDRLDKYADDQRAAVVVESDGRGRSGRDVELLVFRARRWRPLLLEVGFGTALESSSPDVAVADKVSGECLQERAAATERYRARRS